ncbi:amino acid transporter, partial [Rhodotorula sp. JG-1b]
KEHMSLIGGMALIVGIVIGSGIFSSPGVVAKETGSVGSALLVWAGAGLLSWAGGSSFAELGVMLPNNGGHQVYLAAAFGDLAAYCYSFSAVTALKPGSQAISAEYLCRIFFHTAFEADPRAAAREIPTYAVKLVAIAGLFMISALHAWSTKAGKRTQVIVTVFKVLALVLVFIGGLTHIIISKPASDFSFAESSSKPAGYALALFSALWTFDGWDAANYIARDISPGSLPLIINSSLGVIVVLFLLANVSYFLVLPFDIATGTTTIGLDFGRALAGPVGGLVFAIIVSISALGALNGTLYTSSRLIVAASEQGFLPRLFANFNERQKTPINGILLSSALSTVFICLGDFSNLTLFYGVCAWVWNFLVVIGLLVLRVQQPTLKRQVPPYKTFIATPIAFASTALFLIVLSCFSKPWQSLAAFAFCVAGVVPYYV